MRTLLIPLLLLALTAPAAAQVADCSAEACPALLKLESVELDAAEEGWLVGDGQIVQTTPEGNSGTFSWTAPPELITTEGFELTLTVEGTAAKDEMYPIIIYMSGPFVFDPDPPQAHVYLNGDAGKETATIKVKPLSNQLAGGAYVLDIGAAYGKVVHYTYRTVPQLVP